MSDDRPPFLVTIATQRSGTKFLGTSFSAGGLVRSLGEVFQPGPGGSDFRTFFADFVAQRGGFGFEAEEMGSALDLFIEQLRAKVAPAALHFDLMYNNLGSFAPVWTLPVGAPGSNFLANWLKSRRAAVIHLVRPDLAECFASHVIAEARGIYHTGNDKDAARDMSVMLSAEQALSYMLPILRTRRFVQRAFGGYARYLEITYPDFIAGPSVTPETAERIARLAGIPAAEAPRLFGASPLRQTAKDKRSLVTNFDDIDRMARNLQRMVNDG
ncbi:hypothetical protein [Neoroseomonas soli]|uniref:Sulphotransferase Stf0 domain-containing protein n=1 Tax=Neoroseomonas soli TaxID=1081025 RepID=A0A9X9X405_9PROT|nr:hypothetical protein [Neoroseomonas soli]MBR0674134.1 hypothetical protein [Neoroseomonas soli]